MSNDSVKVGPVYGPAINVEPARALAKGLDWSFDTQVADRSEIDETNTAGAKRRYLVFGDPPVNDAPVV